MNEEELRELWRSAGQDAPAIDPKPIGKVSDDWRKRVRRNAKIDITIQIGVTALAVITCIFRPQLWLFTLLMIPICIWYVRELRELYRLDTARADLPVRELLESKIQTFEKFFWRTRFVVYAVNPLAIHAFFYGFGLYKGLPNDPDYTSILIKSIIFVTALYEVAAVIANEIYFKLVYKPAYNQLKDLCEQLKYAA